MKLRKCWMLFLTIAATSCDGGDDDKVVILNPGDGLPVETFEGADVIDMNNDGFPDIVAASRYFDDENFSESRLNIILQDPANAGSFLPQTFTVHDEGANIWDVIAQDIDLDGIPEVLVKSISFDGVALFRQDMANPGQFLPPTRFGSAGFFEPGTADSFDVGLIDGDLYPDIVFTTKQDVFLIHQDVQSPGEFDTAIKIGTGAGPIDIADVAVNSSSGNNEYLMIYSQTALGTFILPPRVATKLNGILGQQAIADLDNDGFPEMVAAMRTGPRDPTLIQIYARGAAGNYLAAETLEVPDSPVVQEFVYAVHIVDINLDGQTDIIVSADEIFVFFQQSDAPDRWAAPVRVAAQR